MGATLDQDNGKSFLCHGSKLGECIWSGFDLPVGREESFYFDEAVLHRKVKVRGVSSLLPSEHTWFVDNPWLGECVKFKSVEIGAKKMAGTTQ